MSDPRPGRFCPSSYRYSPASLARAPEIVADTLYVVGGLYGNLPALDVVERLAATESGVTRVVFNGDFHWLDVDPFAYAEIDRRVAMHIALRGNVETELAAEDAEVGCGCAYPESVSDADVARSNDILSRLRKTARGDSTRRTALAGLPMNAVAEIGGARIAIVHGDPESLAGWGFAHDRLEDPNHLERLAAWCEAAQVDVFASSHTCLPACRALMLHGRQTVVINNGAAGMPNFADTLFGIATRISTRAAPPGLALYGMRVGSVNVDAVRLDYDHEAWVRRFLAMWPAGSPAHRSYFQRIIAGPTYVGSQAGPAVVQLEAERFVSAARA
jgi:predicted phosphodiesterase